MTSCPLPTRTHETAKNMSSALKSVQRPESDVHGGDVGASVLSKRKCGKGSGGYPVRDGLCLLLRKVSEGA